MLASSLTTWLAAVLVGLPAHATRSIDVPYSVVASSDDQRRDLAMQLVAMVHSDASSSDASRRGAATLVGMDAQCLYAATANHVVRDANGQIGPVFLRTRWNISSGFPAKVLPSYDAAADLAVLCIEQPDQKFVPLPRIPFFLKGNTSTLAVGDAMTFYGNGDAVDWHDAKGPMTFRERSGDFLLMGGGGAQGGDSGGGVFAREAAFDELVGVVLSVSEGQVRVLDLGVVLARLAAWNIPASLNSWDFSEADRVHRERAWEGFRPLDSRAPPRQASAQQRVKRLLVRVEGGPPGNTNGLAIGAKGETVFVAVPWRVENTSEAQKYTLRFQGGARTNPVSVVGTATDSFSVLAATLPSATMANLAFAFAPGGPGQVFRFPAPPDSPLRVPVVGADQLTVGTAAYLVGTSQHGLWQILPRELLIARKTAASVELTGEAVARESVGWVAFDDRNRLIGLVTNVEDRKAIVDLLLPRLTSSTLPADANQLSSWQPLSLPVEIQQGGTPAGSVRGCAFPRLVAYGGADHAGDIAANASGVAVTGLTRMLDFVDVESFLIALDGRGGISSATRAPTPGTKGPPIFARPASDGLVQMGYITGLGMDANAPNSCGTLNALGTSGTAPQTRRLCEGTKGLIPLTSILAEGGFIVGGSAVVGKSITAAVLAHVQPSGEFRFLAEDSDAVQYEGVARSPSGEVFVAGFGMSQASQSEDVVIASYSTDGVKRWRFTEPIANTAERATAITMLLDGSVMAVGYVRLHNTDSSYLRIWHLSEAGKLLSKVSYPNATRSEAFDVVSDGEGGAVIAGAVTWPDGTPNGVTDGWLLRIDAAGRIKWQTSLAEKYATYGRRANLKRVVPHAGGYWVLGEISASSLPGSALLVAKVGRDGSLAAGCQSN